MNQSRRRKKQAGKPGPSRSASSAPGTEDSYRPTITLLTDFGLADAYVGTMKGVIVSVNPRARIVDLSHGVAPQDVRGAAFLLAGAFGYFPPGTIHVAIVDPTVGSERSAICVRSGGHYFIGPDNGVLSLACYRAGRPRIHLLENERFFLPQTSRTFHGRDVFAPVAAHLSAGVPLEEFGPRARSMERIRVPVPAMRAGPAVRGQVVHVDGFGNLITNIGRDHIRRAFSGVEEGDLVLSLGDHRIGGLSGTYSDVGSGKALALFGSFDLLEIAIRDGNASSRLGIGRGDRVGIVRREEKS